MRKGIIGGILVATGAIGGYLLNYSKKGPRKYSWKWIEKLSDHEWEKEREVVRKSLCKSGQNFRRAIELEQIIQRFDKIKSIRDWDGKEPGFPVPREHGFYLLHKD